jgi:hypothetical protein
MNWLFRWQVSITVYTIAVKALLLTMLVPLAAYACVKLVVYELNERRAHDAEAAFAEACHTGAADADLCDVFAEHAAN